MNHAAALHQYVERASGELRNEPLYRDRMVSFLYGPVREHMPTLFRALTSTHHTRLLGYLNYDAPWSALAWRRFARDNGIDLAECLDNTENFRSVRDVFERKIRYWETRPMPEQAGAVVSPCDARALVGDCDADSAFHLKEKFFTVAELLGDEHGWVRHFARGHFAIFRLTPDKYHYNHAPVAGSVIRHYRIDGRHHSCNPGAALAVATPYAKNERVVTIIDTDVPGGSGAGKVAMIEIVALMIGEIVQCVSSTRYDDPQPVAPVLFLERGAPKSLFRPGSSTVVLLFEPGRIAFAEDLRRNQARADAMSRYSLGFGHPVVETDIRLRSLLGDARPARSDCAPSANVCNRSSSGAGS